MSLHSHAAGHSLLWSPGAYTPIARVTAPHPTLEEESFFWGASAPLASAIKAYRGVTVAPARTGAIVDVQTFSAAGNSADMLWYKYGVYAWNVEIGNSLPVFRTDDPLADSAHTHTMEFAGGLLELVRIAYDFTRDRVRPTSFLHVTPGTTPGNVNISFSASEPAAVFHTVDGAAPTYSLPRYGAAGIRQGGEIVTVPVGSTVHWFSVDSAGNVESNYRPDGSGRNYNRGAAVVR